jgi:hypothetical protein
MVKREGRQVLYTGGLFYRAIVQLPYPSELELEEKAKVYGMEVELAKFAQSVLPLKGEFFWFQPLYFQVYEHLPSPPPHPFYPFSYQPFMTFTSEIGQRTHAPAHLNGPFRTGTKEGE